MRDVLADERAAFAALSDAVLAIASELSLDPVLHKLVDAARHLGGARYAAIGIPDDEGTGFSRFITSGMSDAQIEAIGPLPRTHGLLGAMLAETLPYRTDDITADPRFWGWPAAHPDMRSFLGVPIVSKGTVIGAVYLTEKHGAGRFDESDEQRIVLLAAHAAIAIDNARLFERSRELSVVSERNRLARELHDAVTQTLFSLTLSARTAAGLVRSDPDRAEAELARLAELARAIQAELRALIFQLRPADLETDGLVATLRHHVDVLGRVHRLPIGLRVDGERRLDPALELGAFRVAQEALHNALRHAAATRVDVTVAADAERLRLTVADDGVGFDPSDRALRSRRLGVTSMRERARELGGRLTIASAPGQGTTVALDLPADGPT